ncbi:MAG: hypothetical protein ACI8UO_003269 [Verrucomicrobiales bacterium]|jgi:hypothetical protein
MKNPVKIVIFLAIAGVFVAGAEYLDQTPAGQKFNQTVFLEMLCGNTEGVGQAEVTYVGFTDGYRVLDEDPWPPSRLDWDVILNRLGPGTQADREAAEAAKKAQEEAAAKSEGDPEAETAIPDHRKDFHDAPVVGIVPSLNWRHDPADNDDVLARKAMKDISLRLRSLVVGTTLGPKGSGGAQDIDPAALRLIERVEGDISKVPEAEAVVEAPDEALVYAGVAAFNQIELSDAVESTVDGIRIPVLARVGEQLLAGFPLQVILEKEHLGPENVSVRFGTENGNVIEIFREDQDGEQTDEIVHSIPVDDRGRLLVFGGVRVGELYPKLDAVGDLILYSSDYDVAEDVSRTDPEVIKTLGKNAVVIGFDTEDNRQFELPGGDKVSRAELMAMAVATVQSGRFITLWPDWMRYSAIGGVALLGCLLIPTRAVSKAGIFISLLILVGYVALTLVTFQSNLSWTPPLAGIGVCLALVITGFLIPKSSGKTPTTPEDETKDASPEPEKKDATKDEAATAA